MNEFLPAFLIEYSDSSFTNPHEVVLDQEPLECTGNFTHMGAKYWGFETVRHCATQMDPETGGFRFDHAAHHSFVIGLKQHSLVREITISTRWFTGNQVPVVSVDLIDDQDEITVVERANLAPDQEHKFSIPETKATRCRVRCYHEGGISRVNLFGNPGESLSDRVNLLEVADISHVSNEHYGSPAMAVAGVRNEDHMIGWESARTGFGEQCVFSFKEAQRVGTLIVDTYLHRLNPPLSAHLFGLPENAELESAIALQPRWRVKFDDGTEVVPESLTEYMAEKSYLNEPAANPEQFNIDLIVPKQSPWVPLVSSAPLKADAWHEITEMETAIPMRHLLYMHFPNGGVHGLKVFAADSL